MKILFICGLYDRSTNGILEAVLAQELRRKGHEVYVVGMTTMDQFGEVNLDGVHTFGIVNPWFHRFNEKYGGRKGYLYKCFFQVVRIVRNICVTLTFPNVNLYRSRRLWLFCRRLVKKYSIDMALCTFQPYEAIATSIKLKKYFGNGIKVVNYHLDLTTMPANTTGVVVSWKKRLAKRALQRELDTIDRLLLPESAEVLHLQSDKVKYVGFPMYNVDCPSVKLPDVFNDNEVNVVYCGSLDSTNRDPLFALRLLERIGTVDGRKIKVHIWGEIYGQKLKDNIISFDCVSYHGFIDSFYVPALLRRADFLLNISNKMTYNMIPSKTFQQLAAHRPIINFVKHPQDFSLRYFDQCGYTLRINEYDGDDGAQCVIAERYIIEYLDKDVIYNDSLYIKSTPQYIAEAIERS